MNKALLKEACKKLGWTYHERGEKLLVTEVNSSANLHGEPALTLTGNRVSYNSYYMKSGGEYVEELRNVFYELNVQYARQTIIQTFESKGFNFKKDWDFSPNEEIVDQFFMVGYSRLKQETEKRTEIKFSIQKDGNIISDSNYIPEDLHELADKAMAEIDQAFGCERREGYEIQRKEIPQKYRHKSYCSVNNKIKAKY